MVQTKLFLHSIITCVEPQATSITFCSRESVEILLGTSIFLRWPRPNWPLWFAPQLNSSPFSVNAITKLKPKTNSGSECTWFENWRKVWGIKLFMQISHIRSNKLTSHKNIFSKVRIDFESGLTPVGCFFFFSGKIASETDLRIQRTHLWSLFR